MVPPPRCVCGSIGLIKTSWTSRNPGRRFYTCSNMERRCGFIRWFDPPMCSRSMEIISGLLNSKNQLDAKIKYLEHEARKWKLLFFITFVSIVPKYEKTKLPIMCRAHDGANGSNIDGDLITDLVPPKIGD
ncbi:hypothetical protein OSB04_un001875 [Centaurea solstitialis]|uniref:GRF-type domain-containing protein n=1 Tax=Centaurea solstitialis TaxID=347529 RepID=A0AA38W290_9ASTR|nr:hypothetical protein OSB04_un001875 [Centaurea solstitialis]